MTGLDAIAILWELPHAQGLQYEARYWIKEGYRVEFITAKRARTDANQESFSQIVPK